MQKMQGLLRALREHRMATLSAIFLLILFVGFSIVSATKVAQRRAQEAAAPQQEGQQEGSGESDGGQADAALSSSQQEAISGYTDEQRELVSLLSASVWSANGGKNTLRFYESGRYVETSNGESAEHTYAITALDRSKDTAGAEVDTIAFETDSGTHIVTLTQTTGSAGEGSDDITSSLSSSSMFTLKDTAYSRVDAARSVHVEGLNEEAVALMGGDEDALVRALSQWCAVHYPSVTEATWNQVISIDYESGTVTMALTLNNENPVVVTVVYKTDTGSFEFGLGGNRA